MRPPRRAIGTAIVAVVAVVVIAVGTGYWAYDNTSSLASVSSTFVTASGSTAVTYGSVSFSGPWHFVGNVTLSDTLSACEALRFPCPMNPTDQAEQFSDGTSSIYAEGITGCEQGSTTSCTTWTVLISNNSVYCITPKVSYEPQCPSIISNA